MLQACFANLAIAILDGAHRKPYGKPIVAAPVVNTNAVNRSAPDLFPVSIMLKEQFIPAQKKSGALSM